MTDFAIKAEGLSKAYRIGARDKRPDTLAGVIAGFVASPFRNLRRLRSLTHFDSGSREAEDVIWALSDFSLDVEEGEVLGIIGQNGAGKSTLLKVLSGITEPTAGRAEVRGRVASLLEVGTGFHPDLTGRENVYLNGTILGMSKREVDRKFDEIVEFAELKRFVDTPIKWYSSGMAVRLAFSVAAHLEADVLLIDEVLAVGDIEFQRKCLGRMGKMASAGRTVLFVSHNMSAVTSMCNKVARIENGTVIALGDARQIVSEYLHRGKLGAARDLSVVPRRTVVDRPIMEAVRLTSNGDPAASVAIGQPLELEVDLDYDPEQMQILQFGFQISAENGMNILGSNTGQYDALIRNGHGGESIRAQIDSLPLAPGTYSISLFIGPGPSEYEVIPAAISFEVTWGEHSEAIRPPEKVWGPLFVPVRWKTLTAAKKATIKVQG